MKPINISPSSHSEMPQGNGPAYLLIWIENWDYLMEKAGNGKEEAISARLSGLIHKHFGSYFRSMTLNKGEFFIILDRKYDQPLLERTRQLKHELDQVRLGNHIPLEVSICFTARFHNHRPFEVLLKLRNALDISSRNATKMLCVI